MQDSLRDSVPESELQACQCTERLVKCPCLTINLPGEKQCTCSKRGNTSKKAHSAEEQKRVPQTGTSGLSILCLSSEMGKEDRGSSGIQKVSVLDAEDAVSRRHSVDATMKQQLALPVQS
jgi:hypothetical protein